MTQTGLLIGSAVTTGVAIAEFGQLSPDPGEELLAQILLALQRDLMRSIPCQILDSFGDYAVHIGNWNSASGFFSAALLCSFASPGTGAKGGNSLMMTGSGGTSSALQKVYNGLKHAPEYPSGFQLRATNHTTKHIINNRSLLQELRGIEPGEWKKVFKDGYDAQGNLISIHFFQSPSGKVFNVKTKNGWSNQ